MVTNLSIRQIDGLESELRHRRSALSLFFGQGWLPASRSAELRHASDRRLSELAMDGARRLIDTGGPSTAADSLVEFADEVATPGRVERWGYALRKGSGRWWARSGAATISRLVRRLRAEVAWRRWIRHPD